MNVLLIGEESAGIQMLGELERRNHRVVAVMTSPPGASQLRASLWGAAQKRGHMTWPAKLVRDPALGERIRSEQVDLLLNVHSLYIINGAVLEAPRIGAFNIHPGPLPRYAGLNAVSWAIYNGERSHGVTVHWMVPEIDAGPIAYQALFPIDETDTALSLSARCVKEGVALMSQLVEMAATDPEAIPALPQDLQKREYFGKEVPGGGRLSWLWPAEKIINFVRACEYCPFPSPWGHPRTRLGNVELEVVKAYYTHVRRDAPPGTVGGVSPEGVRVASSDEWVLVTQLRVGSKFMRPADILTGGQQFENDWR